MIPIFQELPCQLGVYTLTRLLELRDQTALYEAHQTHVDRAVVLEVLAPGASPEEEADFLAQSRLRVASSELPHVAQVYESSCIDGYWVLTQELPMGRSLADITAEGHPLPVTHLCNIIQAAAEMYELCGMVDLSAMPLAASSIYIENNGTARFLSPLVKGALVAPPHQMQSLAAALWPLVPQHQESGLGRVSTLLQWMHEGYEGSWLSWNIIFETASTILNQLETSRRQTQENTLRHKITHNALLLNTRQFIRQWGTYLGICCTLIITLTCLGSLFGLAQPIHLAAAGETGLRCHQDGRNHLLMTHPVTVAEYAQFLQTQAASEEPLPAELESGLEPADWESQQQTPEAPVCGVTYWQAEYYAWTARGGQLPTANQLQLLKQQGVSLPCRWEWSCSEQQSPLPAIYGDTVYLLIDAEGKPYPVSDRKWSSPAAGFRITLPESNQEKDL